MAIRNIKEIINNRGYVINPTDRKIFEEGDLQSFFGFSSNDAIEFIIYDINDNQLPQLNGELVRYISLTTENINDYFLIPEGTIFQRYQLPKEYFIDVERLLSEAGYTNGIFKTQITLLNKRVGSDKQFDKLWIQEISPSRTEVRLLPLNEGIKLNGELQERYNILLNDGDFRDDTIIVLLEFIEKIKPSEISTFIISKYGTKWLDEFISEFKIKDFNVFTTNIYNKFVESCINEFSNRISDIKDINYGKPKPTKPPIQLSKTDIINKCKWILVDIINYYLPQRDVKESTNTIQSFIPSIDEVSQILQREEVDTTVIAKSVELEVKTLQKQNIYEKELTLERLIKTELKDTLIDEKNIPKVLNPIDEVIYVRPEDSFVETIPIKIEYGPIVNTSEPVVFDNKVDEIINQLTKYDRKIGMGNSNQIETSYRDLRPTPIE